MATASEEVAALFEELKAEHDRLLAAPGNAFGKMVRAEQDAQWDALKALATRLDQIHGQDGQ